MTKAELEETIEIRGELEEAERRILRLSRELERMQEGAADGVPGLGRGQPFTLRSLAVPGVSEVDRRTVKRLQEELLARKRREEALIVRLAGSVERAERFIDALESSRARRIFRHHYCDGLTYEQIAEEMDLSVKTVQRTVKKHLECTAE